MSGMSNTNLLPGFSINDFSSSATSSASRIASISCAGIHNGVQMLKFNQVVFGPKMHHAAGLFLPDTAENQNSTMEAIWNNGFW